MALRPPWSIYILYIYAPASDDPAQALVNYWGGMAQRPASSFTRTAPLLKDGMKTQPDNWLLVSRRNLAIVSLADRSLPYLITRRR